MLWKVLHSICNMQYALNMQYAGSRNLDWFIGTDVKIGRLLFLLVVTPSVPGWGAQKLGILVVLVLLGHRLGVSVLAIYSMPSHHHHKPHPYLQLWPLLQTCG